MDKWYVKNTAGRVFGPIDLATLKSWVKDGRVELIHYIKEQSISFEYHRYGSISEVPPVE